MNESKIWTDIEASGTKGKESDTVMVGRPKIQIDSSEFETMYNDGTKLTVIAEYFGVSTHKIRKTRNALNLPKRLNTDTQTKTSSGDSLNHE